ncbi:MAG: hypothetical protein HKN47_08305 [Pirellulaceae bacterium]|nr:hypothetical protein [Pirellulaceae bacterium]
MALVALTAPVGFGQLGQPIPMATPPSIPKPLPVQVQPPNETARMLSEVLDEDVELGELNTQLGHLARELSDQTGLPFFIDQKGIAMAELGTDKSIAATLPRMPLRSALRTVLAPLSLRAVVQTDGLVITADFTELTRRGIATDQWIDQRNNRTSAITKALDQEQSVRFIETPLQDAVMQLSNQSQIPMVVDRRALEEIGLTPDTPVVMEIESVSLRSLLRLMLRELDLTYMVKDEILQITTIEAAEQNLVGRIYFLEATGLPIGDLGHAIAVIQSTIVPDTWESLGGPSTMVPLLQGQGNRPALLISTTTDVHEQIGDLLRLMREHHVGPDPVVDPHAKAEPPKVPRRKPEQSGGMF